MKCWRCSGQAGIQLPPEIFLDKCLGRLENFKTVMMRRVLTLLLLLPMSVNGMWMVCAEAGVPASPPSAAQSGADATATAPSCQGSAMCPLHKPAAAASDASDAGHDEARLAGAGPAGPAGAICLLSPDGSGTSIDAVGFVYAPPAPGQGLEVREKISEMPADFRAAVYADAPPSNATPPPRA